MKITITPVLSLSAVLALSALSIAGSAHAADGATLFQQKTCLTCHGKDAKTPLLPNYPKLAGNNAAYLLEQMKDIKSGARSNGQSAAMKGVMGLVNDDEMKAIADWLATQ